MQVNSSLQGRSKALLIGLFVIGGIFIVRLFWIQVVQYDYYAAKAAELQTGKFTLYAERGQIYARDGQEVAPLVLNESVYLAFADPSVLEDKSRVLDVFRRVAGGNMLDVGDRLDDKTSQYVVLAKNLSQKQAELLKKEKLVGIGFQRSERRVYPEGQLAAQVLGFVNTEGSGKYGLEQALQARLAGKPGQLKAVTDVRQIPLTVGNDDIKTPAQPGEDIVLSIDRNVQAYAESALKAGLDRAKATEGSVIVMNPNNGQVMAMANYPTYDPARYGEVTDYNVFTNKAVSDPYEAGSVIKALTMGVGLDTGAVTKGETFNNTGVIYVDGIPMKNVEEDPIDPAATMTDVLHYSLNTGVVYILQEMGGGRVNKTGRDKLYDYFTNRFFFGRATGIEQAGELPGTVISPDEEQGNNVRYANMAFGQGMDVNMVQVAAAFSASINGGIYYQPRLVSGKLSEDGTVEERQASVVRQSVLKPDVSMTLRDMIVQGRQLGIFGGKDLPGYMVGGKTGTSQKLDPKTGKYSATEEIGSYLGFGGGDRAEYVIMVRVNDAQIGGYAGTSAAGPIFTDISNWMLDYMKVAPKN